MEIYENQLNKISQACIEYFYSHIFNNLFLKQTTLKLSKSVN